MRKSELTWVTPSEIIEYLYCPRFIYYMNCLLIPQNEDQRDKVQIGRNIHTIKKRINNDYLRKRIGVTKKETDCYLVDAELGIRGIVDEVLHLDDGTMAPLDYKFAEYKNRIYETYKYQSVIYGLLIEKNYHKKVNYGYICYIRTKNCLKQIQIDTILRNKVKLIIEDIINIIELSKYPKSTKVKKRCLDCCYRNICVK